MRAPGLSLIHISLPKTIDNDLWGTDLTFGFESAVNIATSVIDSIHSTAFSHSRVFIVETKMCIRDRYDVTVGTVKVGGIDVREYDLEVLRNEVAMVLQKNTLFSGTIKENLRWGNEHASDEEIERVCRLAQADPFIQEMPDKYDTYIEQGGTNVSGGQKQRLCIARAPVSYTHLDVYKRQNPT